MKKFLVLIFSAILSLFLVSNVFAQGGNEKSNVTLNPSETINQDYFAKGEVITISGVVNGDVYAFGEKVVVDGVVNGDLIAVARNIIISGAVSDDLRVAGGQVTVSGQVGKNATVATGDLIITESGRVGGSVLAGAGNVSIYGPIGRGVRLGAGEVTIDSAIDGSLMVASDSVNIGSKSIVNGDFVYFSDRAADIGGGAQINGKTVHNIPDKEKGKQAAKMFAQGALFLRLISLIFAFLIGAAFIKFMPNYTERIVKNIEKKPLISAGIGIVIAILVPVFAIILAVTIIGIPLTFALVTYLILAAYFAKIFVSLVIGRYVLKLLKHQGSRFLELITGLVVYSVLGLLPVIGVLVWVLTILVGMGAFWLSKRDVILQLKAKKLL